MPAYSSQVPFEPGDALGIEVVGGLVQQEEVGAFEQDLAESDAPALAAGERGDVGLAGREPHGVHGDLDAAVEVPPLGRLDGILDLGLLLEQASISSASGPSPSRALISSNRARWPRIGATAISTLPRTSRVGSSIGSWDR